jgi:hypothetical protein
MGLIVYGIKTELMGLKGDLPELPPGINIAVDVENL